MTLETAGSPNIPEVNEQQLRKVFEDDDGRGEFVILSQKSEIYIQASGEGNGPYSLEYRDGDGEHHFCAAGDFRKEDVLRAFAWYLAGDGRWRTEFTWEQVDV